LKKVLAALAIGAAILGGSAAAGGSATSGSGNSRANLIVPNTQGFMAVRFAKGTTPAQMRDAIAAAGGNVTADVSKIGYMGAYPTASDFASKIRASKRVVAAWIDRTMPIPNGADSTTDPAFAGETAPDPQLGASGVSTPPDPWHDLVNGPAPFLRSTAANAAGTGNDGLQWDDLAMNVAPAWSRSQGAGVKVAVIDSGVEGSHKEILPNYDNQTSENAIPCNTLNHDLAAIFGLNGLVSLGDCSSEDTYGHGTWVASRIVGAANGFASNGVAPHATVAGYKALSTKLGFGLNTWIVQAVIDACTNGVDLINMSIGGYDDLSPDGQQDYLMWENAVQYCRAKGTAIFASAGNEHVRINRVNLTIAGQAMTGVGQVDNSNQGIESIIPPSAIAANDLRGLLENPAGLPGVVMVSATNHENGTPDPAFAPPVNEWAPQFWGKRDQLTYYSNYGSRIDVAAPGGARRLNIPRIDGGRGDYLYGGWGTLGALDASAALCDTSADGSLATFACFKVNGAGFGWLQGTSMSAPNATGVAALVLAAHPELRGHPDALLARLEATTRTNMINYTGPNDPRNTSATQAGVPCTTGFCHVDMKHAISFSDAYGAGLLDAAAAVAP
jgi:subtilisin family serine protease